MANEVYANNREVSCKAADGKSICAFPDVCLSPPSPPAGPIPIPYPNTGMASDMTEGSKNVKISGKETMLKDKSYFKKSTGDEAATKSLGMGLVSHQIQGQVYFKSWSMDVKFESENVVRHLDLTTHNHASEPANEAIPWPYADAQCVSPGGNCENEGRKVTENCSSPPEDDQSFQCCEARKCMLLPYNPNKCCKKNGKKLTPHHLVPSADFVPHKIRGKRSQPGQYDSQKAPCLCAEGTDHNRREGPLKMLMEHGRVGRAFTRLRRIFLKKGGNYNVENACKLGAKSGKVIVWECSERCLEHQLKVGHENMGQKGSSPMPRISKQNAPELFKLKIK